MIPDREHLPALLLAGFAVAAGQIGRLGQKLERGEPLGWKNVFVELSMFPAFAAILAALGSEFKMPMWSLLGIGVAAGWTGFASFRLITAVATRTLRLIAKEILGGDGRSEGP